MSAQSPWERVLGDRMGQLDPRLRQYFSAIPRGSVGRGHGILDVVGTPRRWLWPVLALLAVDGVLFPVWSRSVLFSVENRSTTRGTIRARRTFHFDAGDRVMVDEIGVTQSGLTDRLGRHGSISAPLDADIVDGRLELRSTRTTLRFGLLNIPLGALSPRVTLVEQTAGDQQLVSLRLDAPVLGRIYEYEGSFSYTIESDLPSGGEAVE